MSNEIHELGAVNSLGGVNKKMTGSESGSKQKRFMTTEMITPEMREVGVDETTELTTREEMVELLGEEEVARIEAEALSTGKTVFTDEDEKPKKTKVAVKKNK